MVFAALLLASVGAAQTPPPATRTLGVVTKIDSSQMALKTDDGQEVAIKFSPRVSFRRVPPGETDVTKATTIAAGDIAVGDRALAVGRPGEDKIVVATLVIAMSKSDIAKAQASEKADWDKRGVVGIVTAVSNEAIMINVRGPGGMKLLTITPMPNAVVRRYSPESIKFEDAKPSTIASIKVGDQVRARGDKSEDGGRMQAQEIVSGEFKELAATVNSVDPSGKSLTVTDLATKKPVTIRITADSNLRKLPEPLAQRLAAQNRPPEDNPDGRGGRGGPPAEGRGRGPGGDGGPGPGMRGGRGGRGDLGTAVDQSPAMTLTELKKGDALILLTTVGTSQDQLNAVTMLAGVEPILTKPGTREMALGGWSLNGGGGGEP